MAGRPQFHKLSRTIVATGGAYIINYAIYFLLTPYITRTVGTEAYGFVSLARNFAQYAAILSTALNSFASRYIAVSYHQKHLDQANVYFSSTFYGDLMLASAILAAAGGFIAHIGAFLSIPDTLLADVRLLFLFIFVNFWVTTVFTAFEAAAYIRDALDLTAVFKGLSYLAEAVVLLLLYHFLPARVSYVGIGLTCASIVVAIGNIWISRKETPDLLIRRRSFSWSAVGRLLRDGIWTSVNSLGNILNSGLDLVITNQMLSSLAMGQLAIAQTIGTFLQGIFLIVAPPFYPMFLKSYAAGDKKELLSELKLSMKLSGMLANIAYAGFAALGTVFYKLWVPGQDIPLLYVLTLINCWSFVASGPVQPLYYIYTLTVKRMVPCFVTLAGGAANVISMYLLIRHTDLGIYAVVLTTAVIMSVMSFITNPLYMAHVLELPAGTFYPDILRNFVSFAVMVVVFRMISGAIRPQGWAGLLVCAVIDLAAGCLIHVCIACSREQRRALAGMRRHRGQ